MNNSALTLIKDLIESIDDNNRRIIEREKEIGHWLAECNRREILVKNLREENDELRMKLAASKAENKKGFKQSKK